jgi:hypothetical protein
MLLQVLYVTLYNILAMFNVLLIYFFMHNILLGSQQSLGLFHNFFQVSRRLRMDYYKDHDPETSRCDLSGLIQNVKPFQFGTTSVHPHPTANIHPVCIVMHGLAVLNLRNHPLHELRNPSMLLTDIYSDKLLALVYFIFAEYFLLMPEDW